MGISENKLTKINQITRIITVGFGLTWFELIGEAIGFGRKLLRGRANEGMYEVLDYETTLELQDAQGRRASLHKREKVRYLQNNIIAFQDEALGDGEILLNYICSPGVPVDQYRLGLKTHILISLQSVKHKGDQDEFLIEWDTKNSFLAETGFLETAINHKTKRIRANVIFPASRPPQRAFIVQRNQQRRSLLPETSKVKLPDGRWKLCWEMAKPRLFEDYVLVWEW